MGGCSALIERKTAGLADGFARALKQHEDPEIIRQGLPSFLLTLDALLQAHPDRQSLLLAASALNASYAGSFIPEPSRAAAMSDKAMRYASRALCQRQTRLCDPRSLPVEVLKSELAGLGREDVSLLYTVGAAWAGWIQTHSEDWGAVADLARVEAVMQRVIALDPRHEEGMPQLYLGVLATVLTPALGGRPEEGRRYFEEAIALSGGHNLMAKVYYARQYARGIFDRELHDRLLNEVVASDPRAGNFTLGNTLAKAQAEALLKSADEYF